MLGYSDKAFSKHLEARRFCAGLSLEGLAAASGVPASSIARFEAGQAAPDLEAACALAVALGCSIDDLAGLPLPDRRGRADRFA